MIINDKCTGKKPLLDAQGHDPKQYRMTLIAAQKLNKNNIDDSIKR